MVAMMDQELINNAAKSKESICEIIAKWDSPVFYDRLHECLTDDITTYEVLQEIYDDINIIAAFSQGYEMIYTEWKLRNMKESPGNDGLAERTTKDLYAAMKSCRETICRIEATICDEENDTERKPLIEKDLQLLRLQTRAFVSWLRVYEAEVNASLDRMHGPSSFARELQRQRFKEDRKIFAEGIHRRQALMDSSRTISPPNGNGTRSQRVLGLDQARPRAQ